MHGKLHHRLARPAGVAGPDPEAGAGTADERKSWPGRLVCPGAGGRAAGACMSACACCAAGRGRGGVCSADSRLWPPALCGWQALGVHWARARQRRSAAQSRRPSARHMMHLPGGGRGGQAAPCRPWPYLLLLASCYKGRAHCACHLIFYGSFILFYYARTYTDEQGSLFCETKYPLRANK